MGRIPGQWLLVPTAMDLLVYSYNDRGAGSARRAIPDNHSPGGGIDGNGSSGSGRWAISASGLLLARRQLPGHKS
jgi:hypothetical protein